VTEVRLFDHPFAAQPPQCERVESLAQWLLDRYETRSVNYAVFEGEPSGETDITGDADAILRGDAPYYTVLESPGAPVVPFIISMLVSAAISFVLKSTASSNKLDNRSQESPNNQLSNRENRVRAMERVEDIYGTQRSIPTVIMPTYTKYINHRKVEYGYYCIGRGYYDVSDVREGDTLLSEITGSSAAVYAPFTSPNSGSPQLQIGDAIIDNILSVSRSGGVEGTVLKAMNQLQLSGGMRYQLYGPSGGDANVPASSFDIIYQHVNWRKPNFAAVAEVGQTLYISMPNTATVRNDTAGTLYADAATKTYTSTVPQIFKGVVDGSAVNVASDALFNPANLGSKTVVSHTDQTLTVAEALVDENAVGGTTTFTVMVNYSATRTISSVQNGYVVLAGSPQVSIQDYPMGNPGGFLGAAFEGTTMDILVANGLTDWTDWFTLPETDRTEVWTNIVARSGMYKDDGSKQSTNVWYEVQIEQLHPWLAPTGWVETIGGNIEGATSNERAETLERVTGWVGPARVRARRVTPFDYGFSGAVVDEIQWIDLYSVAPVTKSHFGNKTTIHTVTRSTNATTSIARRELNARVSRKLPIYNGSTFSGTFSSNGQLVSGTISATSKIVNILAAVCADPKIGNRNLATDVDMAQLWATQQALDAWHTEAGQFNYTFDKDSTSFEETVQTIADAAFCVPYRQNGKIRLALDRPQTSSVALFTHRNKKPRAETITRKFASDSEYDGVELMYMDPVTEKQETIRLPLDGSYTKLKRVEIPGIRSYEQAWFRANREYRRLIGQRVSIETEVTTDARALLPNSRVDIVDNTRFKSWDGEVVGQSGLVLTLSREVEFLPSTPHSIVLQKRDGTLQSIACTEVVGEPNKVLLATAPAEVIVTTPSNEEGIRTIFSFAADSARGAMAWLVQEIGTSDGQYLRLRAVNYSANYYAADSAAIPSKTGVIN
jgi:hypothetical protein